MKGHKGVLEQEEERPGGGERGREGRGGGKSGGTLTGETPRRTKRKGKTLQGGTLFINEGVWGYGIEPYSITQGEEEEVLLERPERRVWG